MFQIFTSRIQLIQYFLLWLIYAIFHTLSMYWLVNIPLRVLVFDGILHALLFAILGTLLGNIILHVNYKVLPNYLQILNLALFCIFSVGLWIGVGFLIEYVLIERTIVFSLSATLPIRALIGILLSIILTLYFITKILHNNENKETAKIIDNEANKINNIQSIEPLDKIAIKTGTKIDVVSISEILYLQADGDYVQIITEKDRFLKEQTMKYFEEHLPDQQFARVHRSWIVNIEFILRVETFNKQNILVLKNGEQLKASIAGYRLLKSILHL